MFGKDIVIMQAHEDYKERVVMVNYDVISELTFDSLDIVSSGTTDSVYSNLNKKDLEDNLKAKVGFILGLNSINYQYWDLKSGGFTRYINKGLTGALAARAGFELMWNDLLEKNIFNRLHGPESFGLIEKYFGDIPSVESRIEILKESLNPQKVNEVFEVILRDISKSQLDSNTALDISKVMSLSFEDRYLKKIQLALYDIALEAKKHGYCFEEELTVAADYQLPKVLEAMRVISYSKELTEMIVNHKLIDKESEVEKAIRAATIIACEDISHEYGLSIQEIDKWLWLARNNYINKNFHLTITTDY